MLNKLILANLCNRPVRTFLSLLAVGVEVTMILTLVGLSYGTLHGTAWRACGVGARLADLRPAFSGWLWLGGDSFPALWNAEKARNRDIQEDGPLNLQQITAGNRSGPAGDR